MGASRGTKTMGRLGSAQGKKKSKAARAIEEEEEEEGEREMFPWELEDTASMYKVKGNKIVETGAKKLTPQQKKLAKMREQREPEEGKKFSSGSKTQYRKGDKKPKKGR